MDIALLVIFLITDWSIVGIFAAVYGGKHRYREGMIFGVHVPESAVLDEDAAALTAHYRKVNRNFYIINLAAGTGAALLSLGHLSIFMIVWTLWLLEFCIVSMGLLIFAHRRMYSLKVSKKWIVGEPVRTVIVDTSVSSVSEKLPFSHWWHLPVILASILALFFLPHLREYFGNSYLRFLLPGAVLLMEAIFWFVHVWYSHRENVVYSNDSKINLAVNRLTKRVWSGMWIASNYLMLLSMAILLIPLAVRGSTTTLEFFLFLAIQITVIVLITASILWLENKRNDILSADRSPLLVDDDLYWKNGWYSNPDDKRFFVQNRMCSANFSMNMAKPAAKAITGTITAGTILLLVWICAVFVRMDFVKPQLSIRGANVEVTAGMYDISFSRDGILEAELLDSLHVAHFLQVGVVPLLDLLVLVRSTEAVEEVQEGDLALDGCQMGNRGQVHDFLHAALDQHCEAGLAACHNVAVITEDVQGLGSNGTCRNIEHAGQLLSSDLVHVGDHQQQALRSGEGGGNSTCTQRAVHSACSACLRLHLDDLDLVAEDVLLALSGPLVHKVSHRRRGGNGVDGSHVRVGICYMSGSGIAIHGLLCSRHFSSSIQNLVPSARGKRLFAGAGELL